MLKNVSLFGVEIQNSHSIVFYGNQVNGTVLFLFLAKIHSENTILLSNMVAHKSETFDHFTSDRIDWHIFLMNL